MHGVTGGEEAQVAVGVRFRLPAPNLGDLVTSYYFVEVTGAPQAKVEDLLHPEWGNLRFQLRNDWDTLDMTGQVLAVRQVALFGPTSRARPVVARPGAILGVGFTPLGWALLVGCPADYAADQVLAAEDMLGDSVLRLHNDLLLACSDDARVALLDRYFGERAVHGSCREPVTRAVHAALLDPGVATVQAFAKRANLSQSALARACLRDFGFTPKILLRRQRFLRTLAALAANKEQPIGDLLDGAYVDHSHFNREFRRFMGMSPSEYLSLPRLMLRAAAGEREKALGAALQGLHQL